MSTKSVHDVRYATVISLLTVNTDSEMLYNISVHYMCCTSVTMHMHMIKVPKTCRSDHCQQ